MKLIQDKNAHQYWFGQADDDESKPVESLLKGRFGSFLAMGNSAMFTKSYIDASQGWESTRGGSLLCVFFTTPGPVTYASATGYFGVMTH